MIYVTLRFDDGTFSQYTEAFQCMNRFNLPGSIYVIGKHLKEKDAKAEEKNPHYVRISELKEMQESGWEVGYHSYSHDRNWIEDPDQYDKESNPVFLEEKGFNISTFALPHSNYNFEVIKYLRHRYEGILGIPSSLGNPIEYLPFNNLFKCFTITRKVKLMDIVAKIQTAIENNEYLILLFHRIEKGPVNQWSFPLKRFRKLIKILSNYQEEDLLRIVTFKQALETIYLNQNTFL